VRKAFTVATILLMSLPAAATAQQAASGLEILGDTSKPRSIPVGQDEQRLTGTLNVLVRNKAKPARAVRVQYYGADSSPVIVAPGTPRAGSDVRLELVDRSGKRLEQPPLARPGQVLQLRLRFSLPPRVDPSTLDGVLTIVPTDARKPVPGGQLTLAVDGAVALVDGVAFAPQKATVQVTCTFFRRCSGEGDVALVGAGVPALLRDLNGSGEYERRVALTHEGRFAAGVTIKDLRRDPDNPNRATAKIEANGNPAPGQYVGALELSPLSTGPPTLPIAVDSRAWILWALLAIAAGVILAGLLLNHLGLRRRKSQIRRTLRDAIVAYCDERKGLSDELALVWSLDEVVDCGSYGLPRLEDPEWMYYDELNTASRVGSAVRWARNDADLDEAQAAALLIVSRISSWRTMVSEVSALAGLLRDAPTTPYGPLHWEDTSAAHDTAVMIEVAKREPKDAAEAGELRDRVRRQVQWHRAFATAWRLYGRLAAHGSAKHMLEGVELDKLDKAAAPALTRTAAEQDTLLYGLGVKYRRMLKLARDLQIADGLPDDLSARLTSPRSEELDKAIAILDQYAGQPGAAMRALSLAPGALASQAASARGAAVDTPARPLSGAPARYLRQLLLIDLLLSLAVIALTSIAYGATVYDDTWGSLADWATAISAGFAGQVVVKWAALPLYRSLRIGSKAGGGATAPAPAS
jgi:hypothetical protein